MSKKKIKQMLVIELRTLKENVPQNPVAKFAHHVNKAGFFRDRTMYSRKGKHKDRESFRIRYVTLMNTRICWKFTDTFYSECLFRLQTQRVNHQVQALQLKTPNFVTIYAIVLYCQYSLQLSNALHQFR